MIPPQWSSVPDWIRIVANALNPILGKDADGTYLARANHTGTQLAATISDFDTEAATVADAQIAAAKSHPFEELATAPASPTAGQTYYDTALNVVRTWGTDAAWHNHW